MIVRPYGALALLLLSPVVLAEGPATHETARAPASAKTASGPSKAEVDAALQSLSDAAHESDPAKSRSLAESAAPTLVAALKAGNGDCLMLAQAAEAEIRAGHPREAIDITARGSAGDCDVAAMLQLAAWASEYSPSGERRGAGADLAKAERLYMQAAELFGVRNDGGDAWAAALASGAELAILRGDTQAAKDRATEALKHQPPEDVRVRLGVAFLEARSREVGEGTAADELSGLVPDEKQLLAVFSARMEAMRRRLDKGHDDARVLASVAFYSLLTGLDEQTMYAARYLGEAAAIDPSLPDLWYLSGRAADVKAQIEEAKADYRRQIAEHPGTPATRLAINELGHLVATSSGRPAELQEALRGLDAELAKTPDEAAMIDTKGHLLLALGRRADGISMLERAQALQPTEERKLELQGLREKH
jgi:tetratricopeptide (TPR) repeat protein